MNRITQTFERLRATGRRGFIPFVSAGDPDLETSRQIVLALARNGADIIELGVPFTDPMADCTTIQRSSRVALEQGISLRWILQELTRARGNLSAMVDWAIDATGRLRTR